MSWEEKINVLYAFKDQTRNGLFLILKEFLVEIQKYR